MSQHRTFRIPGNASFYRGKIYKIFFRSGGQVYIGSTVRPIKVRMEEHLDDLRRHRHTNRRLQYEYDTRGENDMDFEILAFKRGSMEAILKLEGEYIRGVPAAERCNVDLYPELSYKRDVLLGRKKRR